MSRVNRDISALDSSSSDNEEHQIELSSLSFTALNMHRNPNHHVIAQADQ